MSIEAYSLARYFLSPQAVRVPSKRKHHLIFMMQGWSLALNGDRIFAIDPFAADWGCAYPGMTSPWNDRNRIILRDDRAMLIDTVLQRYKDTSDEILENFIREDDGAWQKAYRRCHPDTPVRERVVTWMDMQEQFLTLASKGL